MPPPVSAPTFYITGRASIRPSAIVLATLAAAGALFLVLWALGQKARMHPGSDDSRSASATPGGDPHEDKDDPNQIDTIVLGDPSDAPVPAKKGNHVSDVHPTILVRLPRFGEQVGLIPDNPAGRLLYAWLAAFNQANGDALAKALPTLSPNAIAGQLDLREATGGFNLISAKEAQPGVLVFRLRDQTPTATEALGTLQMLPNSNPPSIASFSLRGIPPPPPPAPATPK